LNLIGFDNNPDQITNIMPTMEFVDKTGKNQDSFCPEHGYKAVFQQNFEPVFS